MPFTRRSKQPAGNALSRSLDAADVIASLATHENIVVTRRGAGTYVGGIAVPGATSTFTIPFAVITPSTGRELLRLPEGRRSQETRTIYNAEALLVGAQNGNNADLVNVDGVQFEVQLANEWDALTGFYMSIIQRPAT